MDWAIAGTILVAVIGAAATVIVKHMDRSIHRAAQLASERQAVSKSKIDEFQILLDSALRTSKEADRRVQNLTTALALEQSHRMRFEEDARTCMDKVEELQETLEENNEVTEVLRKKVETLQVVAKNNWGLLPESGED